MRSHETSSIRRKAAPVASLIEILFSILCINNSRWRLLEVQSFAPSPTLTSITLSKQAHQHHYTIHHNINLHASNDNSDTSSSSSSYNDDNEEDNAILNELKDKKKETYGTDIPQTDELQQAAKDAENAFLAAMLEQSQQFKEIKSEQGGDAAVSEFRRRIQKGDEAQRLENEKNAAAAAVAALEDDDEGEMRFVQQLNESLVEEEEEPDNKEGKDAWQ
jgi:hypothetical protein